MKKRFILFRVERLIEMTYTELYNLHCEYNKVLHYPILPIFLKSSEFRSSIYYQLVIHHKRHFVNFGGKKIDKLNTPLVDQSSYNKNRNHV